MKDYELSFHRVEVGETLTLPETAVWRDLAYDGAAVLVAVERDSK